MAHYLDYSINEQHNSVQLLPDIRVRTINWEVGRLRIEFLEAVSLRT